MLNNNSTMEAVKGILGCVGFVATGVVKGSLAALCQATLYGGRIVAGSCFAICQSVAMK